MPYYTHLAREEGAYAIVAENICIL